MCMFCDFHYNIKEESYGNGKGYLSVKKRPEVWQSPALPQIF